MKILLLTTFLLFSCNNKPKTFIYQVNKINHEVLLKNNKLKLIDLYSNKYIKELEESQNKIANLYFKKYIEKNNDFSNIIFKQEHIKFALLEQIKYGIPASIKLSQAYLESKKNGKIEYSEHVNYTNNLFGIKGKGKNIVTTEYVLEKNINQIPKHKIIVKERIYINDKIYFKLKIKDDFKKYENTWQSFRDHSLKLQEKRYYPLYVLPKDYKEWANKLGNVNEGGLGYATATNYGEVLISIIEKYHLYLLDF